MSKPSDKNNKRHQEVKKNLEQRESNRRRDEERRKEEKNHKDSEDTCSESHHEKKDRRCFGNCCSAAATAYARLYRSFGTRSLEVLDILQAATPGVPDIIGFRLLALQATTFGELEFPSLQPAARAALAAVAQSCSKNCCCEVVEAIVDATLGYGDLALTTVLISSPIDPLEAAQVLGVVNRAKKYGILPPNSTTAQVEGLTYLEVVAVDPGAESQLGNLLQSYLNTLRIALNSFCPDALRVFDSWEPFRNGLPIPPLPPAPKV